MIDPRVNCVVARLRRLQLEPGSFEERIAVEVDKFIFRRMDDIIVSDLTEAACTLLFTLQQTTLPFLILQDLEDLGLLGFDTKAKVIKECNCNQNCLSAERIYDSDNEGIE